MNTLYSHKFGDHKGRRLTIGCQVLKKSDKTTTYLVTKSTCRKTDMFSKEVGRKITELTDFLISPYFKKVCKNPEETKKYVNSLIVKAYQLPKAKQRSR